MNWLKCIRQKCDSIIAVGGSVLDIKVKGVNIIVSENASDLMQFAGYGNVRRKLKPLVAVPTTAGTGSEVTSVAVIANHEKNIKMIFGSVFLLPDIAIIDSRMTKMITANYHHLLEWMRSPMLSKHIFVWPRIL